MTPAEVFDVTAQIRDLNKKVDRLVKQVELDNKAEKKALERRRRTHPACQATRGSARNPARAWRVNRRALRNLLMLL